ncbi:MAG: M15 family metallopeptidase [Kofleriaceae bacterium]
MHRLLPMLLAWSAIARAEERPDDFVDIAPLVPDAVLDLRYATEHNFTHKQVYPKARCELRRAVAAKLVRAAKALRAQDRRLLIWDCYRPQSVQVLFWKLVPDERYVANPQKGSRHSRGAAIDLGLVAKDGHAVVLPTEFDDFAAAAHRERALKADHGVEARRLETAMRAAGFAGMPTEWWHFDDADATTYPLADDPL